MIHFLRIFGLLALLGSCAAQAETPVETPGSSWLSDAQRELEQREYQASVNEAGLQAPNRAQGFRTYFNEQGIRLVARSADNEPLASIALIGYGRKPVGTSQDIQELGPAEVEANAAQVTLSWPEISARYDNGPQGLQQTFTLEQSPPGAEPLSLVLAISEAVPHINENVAELSGSSGLVQLGSIKAQDATGHELALALANEDGRLLVLVDDQQAKYPITLKSVLTGTTDGQVESNQENAQLGTSVAGAGDVNGDGYADVIVGAILFDAGEEDEGAAFIYFGGPGAFNVTADAQLESNQLNAQMGSSVAGAGDVNDDGFDDVLVGAYLYNNGQNDEGAAFLYLGGAGAFNTAHDALLESNQAEAFLGTSVAGAGDVNGDGFPDVVVGASQYDNGENQEGAAFVYFGGAGAFNTTADALLESNQVDAFMGISVAGAGDVNGDGHSDVIVGANLYDNGEDAEGAAFIYFGGSGAFNTAFDARLESNQADAEMGFSVAGAGDVNGDGFDDVISGARFYTNGDNEEGAAFIYFGNSGAFNLIHDAQLEVNQPDARMGASVAGAGDVNADGYADVVVGAYGYEDGETNEGVALVYFGGSGVFDSAADATLQVNQETAFAGYAVAGAGDVNGDGYADVISGAFFYDNELDAEGAAFLYFGGPKALEPNPDARIESDQAIALMGVSVAGAGDVNGDGFDDVVIGASDYDNGQTDEGAAFIYFGEAGAFNTTAVALLESNQSQAFLGNSVGGAGDVNGDGYADVIVGAWFYSNGENREGAAFIYFGGDGAFNTLADAQLESNQPEAWLGESVAGVSDVNGDGFADVAVGAAQYDNGQNQEGAVFVYFGGAGAFNTVSDAQLESNQVDAFMGVSVAGAGDVNGDGFADVIVGASDYDNGETGEGVALIYFGGAGGFNISVDALLESNQPGAFLGNSVAGAGDVNGDGFADVIVGAWFYSSGQSQEGAAFIYFGGAGAFNTVSDAHIEPNQVGALMGESVASAGDINADGYADVIVGASSFNGGQAGEGAAFVYFGGPGAFSTLADGRIESNQVDAHLGNSVSGAGDVNGDGFADVVAGAPDYDNGHDREGAAYVLFGGAAAFSATADAQLESNQAIALMGVSVAGAGDVNGDGFGDVVIGASDYDNGQVDEGAAFLYYGGTGTFNTAVDALLESNQASAFMGNSVAGAGDVNGDGYSDVIIGAWSYSNGQNNEGTAFIYFGGAGAFNTTADALLEPNQADAWMGSSVAGAGDVNGDGFADVIAGTYLFDNGQADEGAAFIYFGGTGAFDTTADAQLEPNQEASLMGVSVASAGDVNGDGFADVIVGASDHDNGQTNEGAAFIYFGGAGTFNTSADALLESNQPNAYLGHSVSGAGDVNGDGFSDVIAGSWFYDNGQDQEGAAFIYFGGAGAFNAIADAHLEPNRSSVLMGSSVAGAGDVNGDGFADVIVGASQFSNGQGGEGAALLYFGGVGAFNTFADGQIESNQGDAHLGHYVAGAGDLNGDGFADVIAGAPDYDNGHDREGAAFVYFGTARGRLVSANQYRDGGASLVQPWGLSQDADGFIVAMNATSPRGRERARLQVEVCRNGVLFGTLLCDQFTSANWTEIGANPQGSTLSLSATGLTINRLYHWRARVQYAPLNVTAPGVTPPPNPASGPWRRLQANGDVADIRTSKPELIFEDGFE